MIARVGVLHIIGRISLGSGLRMDVEPQRNLRCGGLVEKRGCLCAVG